MDPELQEFLRSIQTTPEPPATGVQGLPPISDARRLVEEEEARLRARARDWADTQRSTDIAEQVGAPVLSPTEPARTETSPLIGTSFANPQYEAATEALNAAARAAMRGRTVGGTTWQEQVTERRGAPIDPELAAQLAGYRESVPRLIEQLGAEDNKYDQDTATIQQDAISESDRLLREAENRRFEEDAFIRARLSAVQEMIDSAAANRINPTPQGIGGQLSGALAVALAQLSGGTAGAQQVQESINRAIDRNIQAQLANQQIMERGTDRSMSLLSSFREQLRDERAAQHAYRAALLGHAAGRVEAMGMRRRGTHAKVAAQLLAEQLRQQQAEALAAAQAAAVEYVRTQTRTPVRRVGPSADTLIRLANAFRQTGDSIGNSVRGDIQESGRQPQAVAPLGFEFLGPQGRARYASLGTEQRARLDSNLRQLETLKESIREFAELAGDENVLLDPNRRARAKAALGRAQLAYNNALADLGALAGPDLRVLSSVLGGDSSDEALITRFSSPGRGGLDEIIASIDREGDRLYQFAGIAPSGSPMARAASGLRLTPRD